MQAAKVHAALSQRHEDSTQVVAQPEPESEMDTSTTLEQQLRLALLLQAEFQAGADLEVGPCAAIHAALSPGRAGEWGILQVDVSTLKGNRVHLPREHHLVPLKVRPVQLTP